MASVWRQTLVLLALSTAVGFGVNAFRSEPLPMTGSLEPPPPPEAGSDFPVTSPEEALLAWEEGAFFLDLRDPLAWEEERVSGSFSVAATSFEDRYFHVVADFGLELPLVVYGAAPDSFEARRAAARLVDLGHVDVRLVTDGLQALLAAGITPEQGPAPGMP